MKRQNLKRAVVFVASLTAIAAIPATASAHCGTTQGSFAVTCEQGVKVYRHNSLSARPRGLTPTQARIEAETIRQKTERSRLAAMQRSEARANALRQRELDIEDYRVRAEDRNFRNRSVVYGGRYGGYTIARPIRVRRVK